MQPVVLKKFIADWSHLPGGEAIDCYGDRSELLPDVRWLGIVHDDGVLFVPLDRVAEFPCYTYQ
jgi:hypothetical protein